MRRRRAAGRMTAEQLIAVDRSLNPGPAVDRDTRNAYAERLKLETGFDVVQVLRARYWLRRGKPAHYNWRG